MVFRIGRLVRITRSLLDVRLSKAGSNNAFCYFRYDSKVRDWGIVTELIFV